jgi:ABC-type iron transport system FetAB ATPase subunit
VEPSLLAARDITVVRDDRRVVDAASVTLEAASIVTIQGGSGSGKSTLLRALATLIPTTAGTVTFEGREPHALGLTEYRRRVAYVPQLPHMFEGTVADNVRTGPGFRGVVLADDEVVALLERVGLGAALAGRAASELSGGERLRVALARALANDPRVLLLDEPTAALDPVAARVILDLLATLAERGTAVLVVTHVAEHAARLGGERFRMTDGVLRADPVEGDA